MSARSFVEHKYFNQITDKNKFVKSHSSYKDRAFCLDLCIYPLNKLVQGVQITWLNILRTLRQIPANLVKPRHCVIRSSLSDGKPILYNYANNWISLVQVIVELINGFNHTC